MNRLLFIMALIGCTGQSGDDDTDTDIGPDPGEEWDHCPSSDTFVGDEKWKGSIFVTNGAVYCEYPFQDHTMAQTIQMKKQLRVVAGRYALPTKGEDLDFYLPVCLLDDTGPLPGSVPGKAKADKTDFFERGPTWWVEANQPRDGASGSVSIRLNQPEDDLSARAEGTGEYGDGLAFGLCTTEECEFEQRSTFAPCEWTPNTCDRFTLENGDSLSLDQYHWIGPVGAGFGAITEARGRLDGTDFSIASQSQLFMSFGHHALSRSATVFFDEPIGEACGLYVNEVTLASEVWTTDCEGNPLTKLTVSEEVHEYHEGPCP